jgi:hypothetical protein
MKKLVPCILAGIFVLSGIGVQAFNIENTTYKDNESIIETVEIDGSSLQIIENGNEFISVNIGTEELYLMNPGQPMMPRMLYTYELPFGATNIQIEAKPSKTSELTLTKQIKPPPAPLPLTPRSDSIIQDKKDNTVYQSDDPYPHAWCSYHIGCGLNGDAKRVTHLTVNVFPMQYHPLTGKLTIAETVDITITYDNPENQIFPLSSTYDLVIISPSKFADELERLVTHKNDFGMIITKS